MTVLNALSKATNNPTIAAIAGVAVGFVLREFGPKLVQAFEHRYFDPKRRHRQVFLEQLDWLEERAQKLNVLAGELRRQPYVDKFRLALLVSRGNTTAHHCGFPEQMLTTWL